MISPRRKAALKLALARGICAARLDRGLTVLQRARLRSRFVRVVNYHDTPPGSEASLRAHLQFYRDRYVPVGYDELDGLLTRGEWRNERPGLAISFDDGLRSNYAVAAALLEEFGFVGWFFIPTGFVDSPVDQQASFARGGRIDCDSDAWPDGRLAMSWDEVRELATRHVIGCHTRSHCRLGPTAGVAQLTREIDDAKRVLAERLGRPCEVFCWVGGEEQSYSAAAAQRIRSADFRMSFMTCSQAVTARTSPLQIQRTNIDADAPLELVRLQLCGITDAANIGKRRRVERLTRTRATRHGGQVADDP